MRVNVTIPDEIAIEARERGLNVSRVAAAALADELDRLRASAELAEYLAVLERELGPVSSADQAEASRWVDQLVDTATQSSRRRRSARTS